MSFNTWLKLNISFSFNLFLIFVSRTCLSGEKQTQWKVNLFVGFFYPCSFFHALSQTHEKMQEKTLAYLHNFTLKKSFGFDTSFCEAIVNFNETNVHPQKGLMEKDRIERLPGQTQVNFSQYGGYVTVDKSAGRALYYYFVEAQHSKDSLPLLLWLNGGIQYYTWSYLSLQLMSLSTSGNTCIFFFFFVLFFVYVFSAFSFY